MKTVFVTSLTALVTCASLLFTGPVLGRDFDLDAMLGDLESQLQTALDQSSQRMEELQPALRDALNEKSQVINDQLEDAMNRGFVQLDEMQANLDEATSNALDQLEAVMSSDEMAELQSFMDQLDEDAVQESFARIGDQLTAFLDLTQQQVQEIRPVVQDFLQRQAETLREFMQQSGGELDALKKRLQETGDDTRERLRSLLTDEQVQRFRDHQDEITERMSEEVFET